jgi:hypothetical protein
MKEKIEKELGVLIGLPLVEAGRVADLEWFSFGKPFEAIDSRGNKKLVSEFAIHIQCAWRITGLNKIIVASRDRYVPRDGWEGNDEDFEWDCHGENLCDQRIDEFFQKNKDLKVKLIEADNHGSCRLVLNGGFILEIFPDDSDVKEHWRLFQPYKKSPHFVVTGQGITD